MFILLSLPSLPGKHTERRTFKKEHSKIRVEGNKKKKSWTVLNSSMLSLRNWKQQKTSISHTHLCVNICSNYFKIKLDPSPLLSYCMLKTTWRYYWSEIEKQADCLPPSASCTSCASGLSVILHQDNALLILPFKCDSWKRTLHPFSATAFSANHWVLPFMLQNYCAVLKEPCIHMILIF